MSQARRTQNVEAAALKRHADQPQFIPACVLAARVEAEIVAVEARLRTLREIQRNQCPST